MLFAFSFVDLLAMDIPGWTTSQLAHRTENLKIASWKKKQSEPRYKRSLIKMLAKENAGGKPSHVVTDLL